jgi:hypothetical protein
MSALDGDSHALSCKVSVRVSVEIDRHVHDDIGVEAVEIERPVGRTATRYLTEGVCTAACS